MCGQKQPVYCRCLYTHSLLFLSFVCLRTIQLLMSCRALVCFKFSSEYLSLITSNPARNRKHSSHVPIALFVVSDNSSCLMHCIDQVGAMKVSHWSNQWTDIYDFTPDPAMPHWGCLPEVGFHRTLPHH